MPWFTEDEFAELHDVLGSDPAQPAEISAAALAIDKVLRLASASLPASTDGLLLGLLEENRSLRGKFEELVTEVEVSLIWSGTVFFD